MSNEKDFFGYTRKPRVDPDHAIAAVPMVPDRLRVDGPITTQQIDTLISLIRGFLETSNEPFLAAQENDFVCTGEWEISLSRTREHGISFSLERKMAPPTKPFGRSPSAE